MKTNNKIFKSVPVVLGNGLQHKQVELTYQDCGDTVEVDEGISSLIQVLWDKGVDTVKSCQEIQPGIIWLEFYSFVFSEPFITMALQSAPDEKTYWRVRGEEEYWSIYEAEDADPPPWQYSFKMEDLSEYYFDGKIQFGAPHQAMIFTSIKFPIADYNWILEAAKDWSGWSKLNLL